MRWRHGFAATALEVFVAGILAAAVAFAATALANGLVAALLAPLALFLAVAGLRRIDDGTPRCLAAFELAPIEAPLKEAQNAAREVNDDKVVRLFDPRQLAIARPSAASPGGVTDTRLDAGQALSDALAQLKQSLR